MLLQSTLLVLLHLVLRVAAQNDCTSLLSLSLPNATVTNATRVVSGTNFTASADPSCYIPTWINSVDICRVIGVVTTSPTSSVEFEMWLPDTWYGRLLASGNSGLGGCVSYPTLDRGSYLNFATIGTNGGHSGTIDPTPFLLPSHTENLIDFAHRAVHVSVGIGKQIASSYYGTAPHHSYYNGCSAGGREGIAVASKYPEDFDGIFAGSPAVDWNNFVGADGIWATYIAANTSSAIPPSVWSTIITQEILRQCDGLDGKMDGIIVDPNLCQWNPDTLLCGPEDDATTCLNQDQVDGLKKFYRPIFGTDGEVLYSAYDPGAEADTTQPFPENGVIAIPTVTWYDYAIYQDPTRSLDNFSVSDLEYAKTVDPVGISTWSNAVDGLGKYRDKGGKVLTFHGTRDPIIPSGQSQRFHSLLSSKLPPSGTYDLDDFYRLFMIPGMGHCAGGPGAWQMGQGIVGGALTGGIVTSVNNETNHDVILSLVAWVEDGEAPDVIIGTDDNGQEWEHCLWPSSKTVWNGTAWNCVPV